MSSPKGTAGKRRPARPGPRTRAAGGPGSGRAAGRSAGATGGRAGAPAAPAAATAAPRWAMPTGLVLSLIGLGTSIYLTIEHYTASKTLACPEGSVVNCQKVTTSPQSMFLHMPVAVLGLAYFVAMLAVNLPFAWRSRSPLIYWGRLGLSGLGVVFVLYLLYAELFELNAICLWCTVVHVVTVALFAVVAVAAALRDPEG